MMGKVEHFPTKDRLHTDVLEEKYGEIHAKVLRHDDVRSKHQEPAIREAHLQDKENISRTYALTFLTYDKSDDLLYQIDSEIRDGGSIGKTFRKHGFLIRKNVIDVFTLPLTDKLRDEFHVTGEHAKARVSEFYAKNKKTSPIVYGQVMELYSPDFRGPIINEVDIKQIHPITHVAEKYGISKDVLWDYLDESKQGKTILDEEKLNQAKEESLDEVFKLRKQIQDYLEQRN